MCGPVCVHASTARRALGPQHVNLYDTGFLNLIRVAASPIVFVILTQLYKYTQFLWVFKIYVCIRRIDAFGKKRRNGKQLGALQHHLSHFSPQRTSGCLSEHRPKPTWQHTIMTLINQDTVNSMSTWSQHGGCKQHIVDTAATCLKQTNGKQFGVGPRYNYRPLLSCSMRLEASWEMPVSVR